MPDARSSLRARLEKARAERFVDLRVPGLEDVFVRYRALEATELDRAAKRNRNRKDEPAVLAASVDVLVDACVGVFEVRDGEGASPVDGFDGRVDLDTHAITGELPTFSSPELGAELGVGDDRAGSVVRALYVTEPDIIGVADAVIVHSGTNSEQLLAEARGN